MSYLIPDRKKFNTLHEFLLVRGQWGLISLTIFLFAISPLTYCDDGGKLLYAGFAFSGDYSNRQSLYPYSSDIAQEQVDGKPLLDKILREKLMASPALASRVSLELDDGKRESTSSVAFALVRENVEFQRVDGKYWVALNLQANVLAYNRASGSVVASYPIRMRTTDVRDAIPSDQELHNMVRDAYLSLNKDKNIFDQWTEKFAKTNIKKAAHKYIRVTDIVVKPDAEKSIAEAGQNLNAVKNQVANLLEASISDQSNVPIVPNSVGEAIGSKMAYRFSNGESLNLSLPEPDFAIVFTLRGFASKTIEISAAYQDIFRVKGTVSLTQPDLGKKYLSEDIYNTRYVTRPKSAEVELTTWNQYFKTLEELIVITSKELTRVDDEWLINNASRKLEAKDGFDQSNRILQELI